MSESSASNTTVNSLRRRRADEKSPSAGSSASSRSGYAASLLRMYKEEQHGIKVDPIVVIVMCVIFIGSVFILHIWGKYLRA